MSSSVPKQQKSPPPAPPPGPPVRFAYDHSEKIRQLPPAKPGKSK